MKQTKLTKPYEGDDIADFTRNNKFHRSSSEAFKDAKYAEWFENDDDMSDCKLFLSEFAFLVVPLILFGFFMYWLINLLVEVVK